MIKVTIQEAGKRRGVENGTQFAKSVGYKRPVGIRIWNGEQEPRLKTLDKICKAWGCELSELVTYKRNSSNGTKARKRK